MSAPQTDMEKQTRRHRWPLIGMAVVVIFGVFLIGYWLFEEAAQTEQPEAEVPAGSADIETAPQVAPEAGAPTPTAPTAPAAPTPPAPTPQ